MKVRFLNLLLCAVLFLLGGHSPSPLQHGFLQQELTGLQAKGLTYRFLDETTVEVKQEWSGFSRVFKTVGPSEAQILAWADTHGIPVITIDPNTIDTSRFTGWYRYWTTLPLSNTIAGPLVVGDIDRNGRVEVYGTHFDSTHREFETRVYEVDSTGDVTLAYNYGQPRPSQLLTDIDQDSLRELIIDFAGVITDYEQNSRTDLPTALRFAHRRFQGNNVGAGGFGIHVGSLDADKNLDCLYEGSEPDSADTTLGIVKVYVAEFSPHQNNLQRVWGQSLHPNLGGFAVEDFDRDLRMEFVCSDVFGRVYVVENIGDNQYQLVFRDSLPFVNAYYQTAGDVDNDGIPEFFIGAVTDGYWLTMYESDRDNHYIPKLLIHFLQGGLFPTNQVIDIDDDGRLELVVMSGRDLYVFKSNSDNNYSIWFLKRENRQEGGVRFYDLNQDRRKDFIIGKTVTDTEGRLRLYADVYIRSSVSGVRQAEADEQAHQLTAQVYPNPFNPTLEIRYDLPKPDIVFIEALDIGGRRIATIFEKQFQHSGINKISWNAGGLASAIYFVRIQTTTMSFTRRAILIR